MSMWREMPVGMNLKSLGFATTIPVPGGPTFPEYCRAHGSEDYEPIEFQTFAEYGLEIQRQFVPYVEDTRVTHVEQTPSGFRLTLQTGEQVEARRVVLAVGMGYFPRIAEPLDRLPEDRVRHTWGHIDFDAYAGKDVIVVGGGSSAAETAVLLHEHGARVRVIARSDVPFVGRGPREWERSLIDRIKLPISTLGHSRENWVLEHFPYLMHYLPAQRRLRFTRNHLGPFSLWWLVDRWTDKFPVHKYTSLQDVTFANDRVQMRVNQRGVGEQTFEADYVIAATGYSMELARIPFLSPELSRRIRRWDKMPRLSHYFESSVPGLFFIGPIAAESFGPLVRFVAGTQFSVSVVAKHLARHKRRFARQVTQPVANTAPTFGVRPNDVMVAAERSSV